jgi:hypothetical protein
VEVPVAPGFAVILAQRKPRKKQHGLEKLQLTHHKEGQLTFRPARLTKAWASFTVRSLSDIQKEQ